MTTKQFKGKAIYNPSGKAGEYSYWACNFYNGCSNNCDYCYCKRGVMSAAWSEEPYLKKCFRDEEHALEIFEKELKQNLSELQKCGLFFSFTTDPMLPETIELTLSAIHICHKNKIPVKVLTKTGSLEAEYLNINASVWGWDKKLITYMVTLTGHDDLEPGAASNENRIAGLENMKKSGFRTGVSIEPIITFPASLEMIERTVDYCDLYKIGLKSGMKCDPEMLNRFIRAVISTTESMGSKVYFKDGLLQQAGISRDQLPANCVGRDYNIFK